jgi:cell division protein FtsB
MLSSTNPWQEQRRKATLEQTRELVRQHVRDSNLDILSKAMLQVMIDRSWTMDELKALCKSYNLAIFEEDWMMSKEQELQLLKDQMKALDKKIEKLEHGKWGKEPSNGTAFKIEKSYVSGGQRYAFVALKAGGLWYLTGTGTEAAKSYTWDGLKAVAGKYARVWRLTVAEELLD